ncbi:hypothetical protein ACIQXQ_07775 [Peribacillus sp. NPDC097198]|uniref:hypothetical protein n=1 Tax=Peribacillus sp. NPDC097198 TaxID=3364397 RepID=UPI003820B5D8
MSSLSAYMPQDNREVFRKGLKAGLWMDESFDWYPEEDMMSQPGGEIRSLLQTFTQGKITFSKFTIRNTSFEPKYPKMFFHYENAFEKQAVAFYSPGERAILHVATQSIALLGGVVKGKGISQYCIQGKGSLYQEGCFKSLKEGILAYSPLAKGEVTSMFTLETEILPKECVEVVAWAIHAETKEEAKLLNHNLLQTMKNGEN